MASQPDASKRPFGLLTRRWFLASAAAGLANAQRRNGLPNFVIVLIDDLGWADLGCYGSRYYDTPNLDRLAAQGMRFTNGYAACPVCSPTRASVLTGKYPARLHLTDWIPGRRQWPAARLRVPAFAQQLALEEVTIAEALKPAGYVSASIGKWHLGREAHYPEKQGFDQNAGGTERGSPPSYFPPYKIPGLEARFGDEYLADHLAWRAGRFLEQNRDRPFFLYLPHFSVHIPLGGPGDLVEKYRGKPAWTEGGQQHAVYAAMVEGMDRAVGELLRRLDELKLADNTVVFFLSDNGGLRYEGGRTELITTNYPLRAGKGHLYEGGIRVPWIVRWPGKVAPGSTNDTPVSTVDLFPTILAAAGVKAAVPDVDGVDLAPELTRRGRLGRRALYWHYPHYSNQGGVPSGAVRMDNYKLIEFYEDGRRELFDLRADPGERANLAVKLPAKTEELDGVLRRWRERVQAEMPAPNPDYDAAKADQGLTGAEPATAPR